MIAKIREGVDVLSNEGPIAFTSEVVSFLFGPIYWRFADSFTLSTDGLTISFSAPNRTAVERTKRRFAGEKRELCDLMDELEPDDVFFDIGANTGLYTLFASKKCTDGSVVAFEPYPPNVTVLKRDIKRNDLHNVTVKDLVLSNTDGTVEFDQPSTTDVGYGSASIGSAKSGETETVPAAAGDTLVSNGEIPQPNVVKIDVEGAEPLVLEGLENTLSSSECRVAYCEVHLEADEDRPSISDFGVDIEDIKRQFEEGGYVVETFEDRESEVFLKAYR